MQLSDLKSINEKFMIGVNWVVVQPNEKELEDAYNQNYYHSDEKICQVCGVGFKHGRSNAHLCNACHVYSICPCCDKLHEINFKSLSGTAISSLVTAIQNNDKIINFCSKECQYQYLNTSDKMKEQARNNCKVINNRELIFCPECNKETMHNGFGTCLECNPLWTNQFCDVCQKETLHYDEKCNVCNPIGYHKEFCDICQEETMHNGIYCCECDSSHTGQYGFNGKFNGPTMKFCDTCGKETPHDTDGNCLACSGERIWCNHCECWETKERNAIPDHWIYYRRKTREWIENNPNQVEFLKDNIIGFVKIENKVISGIYCWKIDDIPYYIGQAVDILDRSYIHMYEIWNSSKYWLDINGNFNRHNLSIEVLEECDKEDLDKREICWVDKLKPISQKCNNTDSIIALQDREYNLFNIKEYYKRRMNYGNEDQC